MFGPVNILPQPDFPELSARLLFPPAECAPMKSLFRSIRIKTIFVSVFLANKTYLHLGYFVPFLLNGTEWTTSKDRDSRYFGYLLIPRTSCTDLFHDSSLLLCSS